MSPQGQSGRSVKLTTHVHMMPRSYPKLASRSLGVWSPHVGSTGANSNNESVFFGCRRLATQKFADLVIGVVNTAIFCSHCASSSSDVQLGPSQGPSSFTFVGWGTYSLVRAFLSLRFVFASPQACAQRTRPAHHSPSRLWLPAEHSRCQR